MAHASHPAGAAAGSMCFRPEWLPAPIGVGAGRWRRESCRPVEPENLAGVSDDHFRAERLGFLDHVLRPAWAVARLAIPQRQKGYPMMAERQRIVQHPQVAALPDTVVRLLTQPAR